MTDTVIRRALLSVADKSGVADFAHALADRGIKLLSTGGTARTLRAAGISVTDVSDHTGAPELLDGRVKTLHPTIHAGILGRRDTDAAAMAEHAIDPIDLVVVNLYPFAETVARPGCTRAEAIENIDIGGPAMLRAAAKNHAFVTVIGDPGDYEGLIAELDAHNGAVSAKTRARLAAQGFAQSAAYDDAVSHYFGSFDSDGERCDFPITYNRQWRLAQTLRYGENPHQAAAFYASDDDATMSVSHARQLQGKALSYNNLADTDAALACISGFSTEPACVIVKHANPCGAAVAASLEAAYQRAFATDPVSAFGGILAFNRELDAATAAAILANQFAEVIVAPAIADAARPLLARKKNLRVLTVAGFGAERQPGLVLKQLAGGLLLQEEDTPLLEESALRVVTQRVPDAAEHQDLLFAWHIAKYVKSNAIVYACDGATVGIGAGQMSRVDAARIAALKAADAGLSLTGAVVASDAFYPFRDGVDAAVEAGVRALIQPGGSMRDQEVIAAADQAGMAMLFTGMRHFRH